MKEGNLRLTEDELVLVTGCLTITASLVTGKMQNVDELVTLVKRQTLCLPSLNKKLEKLWDELLPDVERPS
jgi:hypothetical protein